MLKSTWLPLLIFAASTGLAAFLGIDPLRSLEKIAGFALLTALIPLYAEAGGSFGAVRILCALLAGQTVASLHTVLSAAFPGSVKQIFLGQVTESGQLALCLPIAIGLVDFISVRNGRGGPAGQFSRNSRPLLCFSHSPYGYLLGCVNFILICLAGFPAYLHTSHAFHLALVALALGCLFCACIPALKALRRNSEDSEALLRLLLAGPLPLLAGAMLINLKRGPWAGVLAGCLILIFLYGRRYLFWVLALIVAFSFSLPPVHQRLAGSADDFFIAGGRAEIWEIGVELATRYPLGIGYKNSSFLRNFSSEIPPQLTHFHNNLLNVAVETGWMSLMILLWWLYLLLKTSLSEPYRAPQSILRAATGCAFISWQVAGTVEYNFGDAEVWLIVLLLTGLLTALKGMEQESSSDRQDFLENAG